MSQTLFDELDSSLAALKSDGLFKAERLIDGPQDAAIQIGHGEDGRQVLNFCANNYLGLANHPQAIKAAHKALDEYGYGMASVRFICGTQTIHKQLEARLSQFLGTDDCILYPSCFDANGGLFETVLGPDDAVISDALNHASIIDGIRLCKAKRHRYSHNDMQALEACLQESANSRVRLIVTDGVFSMDGTIAQLDKIRALADRYDALVMIDDCHGAGFLGAGGRGTHELHGLLGKIDIITGTLGKALGGASGGYTAARGDIVAWLRQRSRPYLFSNTVAPVIAATSIAILDLIEADQSLAQQLHANAIRWRTGLANVGFELKPGEHPIVPVMLGDAQLASAMADALLDEGVYVIGFSYPVVPKGEARIRTQLSAAHTSEQIDTAIAAFERVGRRLGVIQ
ncbi:MAG: glycine C-acetyltransferase [Pseudomonadota bacterium]